jgi:ankyrin repeat protein
MLRHATGSFIVEYYVIFVRDGSTPLYIACQENKLSVVKYLLSKTANIEATFKSGFTSMYIAAQKGHLEIVKCLLENGARVNAAAGKHI